MRLLELGALGAAVGALALWLSIPTTAPLARMNPPTTAFIELRKQQAAANNAPFILQWSWRRIGEISPYLRYAVVLAEDGSFWKHDGIDMDAIEQAAEKAMEVGVKEATVGGSTITQQLAKNLYLSPDRSYVRKARELLITQRLEQSLSKERILELYLNVAEWGDGVFGAEAASRRYYKRSARELSPAQAARLAISLPNPFYRNPSVRTPKLARRAARLVRLMHAHRYINAAQRDAALAELGVSPTATATSSAASPAWAP